MNPAQLFGREAGNMTVIQTIRPATMPDRITSAGQIDAALIIDFVQWVDGSDNTTRTYITNLRQFCAWLAFSQIRQPNRNDILNFKAWLLSEHDAIRLDPGSAAGWSWRLDATGAPIRLTCKPNTAALYLRSVSQLFKWTDAAGIYPNIAANVHPPKIRRDTHRRECFTPAEVLEIENSIIETAHKKTQTAQEMIKDTAGRTQRSTEQGKRLLVMYLLAVNAGLRCIELSRANVQDFTTKGGRAWLYIWGKGHTEPDQRKTLAPEVADAIRDYLKTRTDKYTGSSPLFTATGNRSGGKRLSPTTISKLLKDAMRTAGYNSDRLTAHSLRHTAGTTVQELTGDLFITQRYMRHTDPATTEIYLHNETETAEAKTAQALYNRYHGIETRSRPELGAILDTLTPAQLDQLAQLAAVMGKAK